MQTSFPPFPVHRPRRLRAREAIRRLVSENSLSASDLIWPVFVHENEGMPIPVSSMPGVSRLSIGQVVDAAQQAAELGIPAIALFPSVDSSLKTSGCEEAWNPENLANRAARAVRLAVPAIEVMLDVALDPYNSDGHDGLLRNGEILNDETLDCLERQALCHAEAGATILGPSDMMDGRIARIRSALEDHGHDGVVILSYASKFASAFYGPFRDAVGSMGTLKGNKSTYQIDPGNSDEAVRMAMRDIQEGADAVMVKPGMPYLDICRRISDLGAAPTFAYQVSGEYAMIRHAADKGCLDLESVVLESLLAFKRAGCVGILSYFAPFAAGLLNRG
ncbi:MAG: porphobilinogen synthase [Rhodobacteraceae bacterium]|nr:porphobilinogen synthase [Paracoccaceae bacterium]